MKLPELIWFCKGYIITGFSVIILLTVAFPEANAQELPPRPTINPGIPELPPRPLSVTVNLSQNLSFGAFYHFNTGGSVIINSDGSRSSTGDVVLLNMGYTFSAGLYDLVGNPGTLVSILNGPDAILIGSNGGSMTLQIGDTEPTSPFIITTLSPASTQLRIGGTLIVGNPLANPPGNYNGTFDITFVQE
ncbi:MAG: DUF4402 domain-containing protein [Bacteroidales bacterium]|nr:DUF4402 domain-containing protein [Bacteroidales bacterium]